MLPKQHRLNKETDISRVFKTGSKHSGPYMLIINKTTTQERLARIACVVSKKVHSSAVVRNKYRRWMRQIASQIVTQHPAGFDMMMIAKPAILSVKNLKQLQNSALKQLESLFNSGRLIHK